MARGKRRIALRARHAPSRRALLVLVAPVAEGGLVTRASAEAGIGPTERQRLLRTLREELAEHGVAGGSGPPFVSRKRDVIS